MARYWKRLPSSVRQVAIVVVVGFIVSYSMWLFMGGSEAFLVAENFLTSHGQVSSRIGDVAQVEIEGRKKLNWSPVGTRAIFDLKAIGETGALKAEVRVEKDPEGKWRVYSATLHTDEGLVSLIDSGW